MLTLSRALMVAGGVLFLAGGAIYLADRFRIPLGRLPGDLRFEGQGFTCVVPLATGIILSLFLTILLNIIVRIANR